MHDAGIRRRRHCVVAAAVLAVIALVGCGDDDATTEPAGTSAATTITAPVTVAAPDDAAGSPDAAGSYVATGAADLELRVVAGVATADETELTAGPDQIVLTGPEGELVYLLGPVELDGSIVDRTTAVFDDLNGWSVLVEMTPDGSVSFDELAAEVVGEQLAIVSSGIVWGAPVVRQPSFGGTAIISGDFSPPEAEELARRVAGVP